MEAAHASHSDIIWKTEVSLFQQELPVFPKPWRSLVILVGYVCDPNMITWSDTDQTPKTSGGPGVKQTKSLLKTLNMFGLEKEKTSFFLHCSS